MKILFNLLFFLIISKNFCFSQDSSASKLINKEILFDIKLKSLIYSGYDFFDCNRISGEINSTSHKILAQKGFSSAIFIKVKVRPRWFLAGRLFATGSTAKEFFLHQGIDSTGRSVTINTDSLYVAVISRKIGVPLSSVDNDYLESKLDSNDYYFQDPNKEFHNYYFIYNEGNAYLLKVDDIYQPLSHNFRKMVYNSSIPFFKDKANDVFWDYDLRNNPKRKLPAELFEHIVVEELGTDFLKLLPGNVR